MYVNRYAMPGRQRRPIPVDFRTPRHERLWPDVLLPASRPRLTLGRPRSEAGYECAATATSRMSTMVPSIAINQCAMVRIQLVAIRRRMLASSYPLSVIRP